MTSITLTVDKSHLITIGERLYVESLDLIRELVNNAYSALYSESHHLEKDVGPAMTRSLQQSLKELM